MVSLTIPSFVPLPKGREVKNWKCVQYEVWDWDRIGTGASLRMSVSICDLSLLQKYKYVFHFHHFVCPENMLSAGEENRFLEKAKRKIPKLLSKYATNIFSFGLACLGFNIVQFKFWYKLIYSLEFLFTV